MEAINKDKFNVKVLRDSSDEAACSESVTWAVKYLSNMLIQKGIHVEETSLSAAVDNEGVRLIIIGADSLSAHKYLQKNGGECPEGPESFTIQGVPTSGEIIVAGFDARGVVYALLELADRIRYGDDPFKAITEFAPYTGRPANTIRAISRSFCSEIEDKPWFYDEAFWEGYLTELATHRINRIHLTLGISYDYGHDPNVRDNYFGFAYPFFVSVPGYRVRVKELLEEEREQNLKMLRFISRESKRRGLHFQLGLWNHAYKMADSPDELHTIEGVDETNHSVYCRDALSYLLTSCPDIDGVTIRTHYEGGIPEPSHVFWREVMKGLTECGRSVEIDMHPKGVDAKMLEVALETGMPVIVSPKFWAEHMGLPYHQAAIRTRELPVATTERAELMGVTNTYRRFTRYGYADYLNENRKTGVLHRIWPGTQRVLLWGDPAMAAGYGRSGSFCGSLGIELCEPMSFKARKTSGSPGGRELYKDASLQLGDESWKKYLYTYRLWGRLMYNPDAEADEWRRYLRYEFQEAAKDCEQALAYASRILLMLTTAHLPSASNNYFWPEMYNNHAVVKTDKLSETAFDTPAPHTFGAVSPLDTAIFYGIDEYVDALLQGKLRGKYTPLEVADRLTELARSAERHLISAYSLVTNPADATYRRWTVDIAVQAGLGHFFARKLRAGVSYALFERTEDTEKLQEAIADYQSAKSAWEQIIALTRDVYRDDITFGYKPFMKGHWADRLAGIEEDIAAMERVYQTAVVDGAAARPEVSPQAAVTGEHANAESGLTTTVKPHPICSHEPPAAFRRGESLDIRLTLSGDRAAMVASVTLLYRHANQSEAFESVMMQLQNGTYSAVIPGSYTDSAFPIVYFFELSNQVGEMWLAPGLQEDLSNQPYYAIREQ